MAVREFRTTALNIRRLNQKLSAWDRWLRLAQSVRWLPRGLIIGLTISLGLAIAARFYPLYVKNQLLLFSAGLAVIGVALCLIVVWAWRRPMLKKARRFDRVFGLKERLATAVEIAEGILYVESDELARSQFDETMLVSSQVHTPEYLPIRTDWREWLVVAILIAGIAAAVFIPNPQETVLQQQAEIEQAITEELETLEQIKRQVETDATLTVEEQQQILEVLDDTIETLEMNNISQEEAVAALEDAARQLDDLSQEFAEARQQALQEASQSFEGSPAEQAAEALAQGNALEAAEALSDIDVDSLSAEEQQSLAEALEQAAEQLEESDPELAETLQEAADALRSGNTAAAQAALDQAAEDIAEGATGGNVQQVDEFGDSLEQGGEQVGQAGQRGQRTPGEGGGDGTQPGQGGIQQVQPVPGSGVGEGANPLEGEGPGSGGAGRGEPDGVAQGGPEQQMDTDNGPGDGGITDFEQIYSPQRIGGEGGPEVDVPGDPGAGVPTGAEGDFAENPSGESTVPYDEVFSDYEGSANEALESGYVPLGLRDVVRDYFGRLDPE